MVWNDVRKRDMNTRFDPEGSITEFEKHWIKPHQLRGEEMNYVKVVEQS